MVIGVDIDDVVADLLPAWVESYNTVWGDQLDWRKITQWDMLPFVKKACGVAVYHLLTDRLYDDVEPMLGALGAIERLEQAGHRLVYITSGVPRGQDAMRKLRWLEEWSFLSEGDHAHNYMVAYDKGLLSADVLIDDKPENCQAFADNCGWAILFDRPHNRSFTPTPGIVRAADWPEVLRLILGEQNEPQTTAPRPTLPQHDWVTSLHLFASDAEAPVPPMPPAANPTPRVILTEWYDGQKMQQSYIHLESTPILALDKNDSVYWTHTDEVLYQHALGQHRLIDGYEYEPIGALPSPVAPDVPGAVHRMYAGCAWQRVMRPDDPEHAAAMKYVTGELAIIDGLVYEPWTAFWTFMPVVPDLVQHPGDEFRYYAGHWWRLIGSQASTPAAVPMPTVEKADHLLALAPMPELVNVCGASADGHSQPGDLATGGVKYDSDKTRFDLLPPYPLMELARLFTAGTRKYADRNWELGMPYGKIFSAMQRHAWKWWAGDETDAETQANHLTAVAWCAFVLLEYTATHPEFDDRPETDTEHINDTLIAAEVDYDPLAG